MRLLLDTRALLWALSSPGLMPRRVVRSLSDPSNLVCVSAASAWEICIKAALGKINVDLPELVRGIGDAGFDPLPVSIAHTVRLHALPAHHRDPFDRILVAQALEEGLTIVTHDRAFALYPAPAFWG